MKSITEVVEEYGNEILGLNLGRRALAVWLRETLGEDYTEHFARGVLTELRYAQDNEPEPIPYMERAHFLTGTVEERLRAAYGIDDPAWVPVGIWGEPGSPRAKWERRGPGLESDKLQDAIENSQARDVKTHVETMLDGVGVAVLSIRDTHFGMFTSTPQPYKEYDLHEASLAYVDAATNLMDKSAAFGTEVLIIPFGSDLLHVDNPQSTTTKGTPQEVSAPWYEAFQAAMDSLVTVVDYALDMCHYPRVVLVFEPGNHDANLALALCMGLEGRWDERVTMLGGRAGVKRVTHGNTHLFFHHGDGIKPEAYAALIAADHPDTVAADQYVEVLSGHLHHRRKSVLNASGDYLESGAIVHRITPALCPSSNWAEYQGFRSTPGAQLTVYDTDGFVGLLEWRPGMNKAPD